MRSILGLLLMNLVGLRTASSLPPLVFAVMPNMHMSAFTVPTSARINNCTTQSEAPIGMLV